MQANDPLLCDWGAIVLGRHRTLRWVRHGEVVPGAGGRVDCDVGAAVEVEVDVEVAVGVAVAVGVGVGVSVDVGTGLEVALGDCVGVGAGEAVGVTPLAPGSLSSVIPSTEDAILTNA
jgi:hypothetical protein